jgi:DNA-binding response OmpR family regulator
MSAAPDGASARLGRQTVSENQGMGRNILVVDDDISLNTVIANTLKRVGYSADSAENGERAWDAICAAKFDLLITDHSMPILNGLDLLRRLRQNAISVPAILMSADMPRNVADIIELVSPEGALHKPFAMDDLLFKVGTILDREQGSMRDPRVETSIDPSAFARKERAFRQSATDTNLTHLASKLLDYESVPDALNSKKPAIFRVCDKMRTLLLNVAGEMGFRSILANALVLSRPEVKWLEPVEISKSGFFEGFTKAEANLTPSEISRGETIFVAHILGLLFTFVGEAMTRILLQEGWAEIPST